MLVVSLGNWKRYVGAALASASVISLPILAAWALVTYKYFYDLSTTATYPVPGVGLGFWLGFGGSLSLVLATFVFYRLSKGLKYSPTSKVIGTGNAGLLDMAEQKYLTKSKLADDTDDEEDAA